MIKRARAEEQFPQSTRGLIVALLRRNRYTVDELASEVRLTDNAVRAHLIALERDDLVRQGDVRHGIGKPAYTYTLPPQAERLFPKAYGLVLLEILGQRIPRDTLTDVLHEVGYRLAAPHLSGNDPLPTRVDNAVALIDDLGGLAEPEPTERGYVIQGRRCPLSEAVEGGSDRMPARRDAPRGCHRRGRPGSVWHRPGPTLSFRDRRDHHGRPSRRSSGRRDARRKLTGPDKLLALHTRRPRVPGLLAPDVASRF